MENKAENDRLKPPQEREAVRADDGPQAEIVAAEAHAEYELEVLRAEGELEELP